MILGDNITGSNDMKHANTRITGLNLPGKPGEVTEFSQSWRSWEKVRQF